MSDFKLRQNYPNPFNPRTDITYIIPEQTHVKLTVFDLLGRVVTDLVDEEKPAGEYNVEWDASGLSSGIYFYRLRSDDFVKTKKMVLLK